MRDAGPITPEYVQPLRHTAAHYEQYEREVLTMTEKMNEINEIKINALEEKELTLEESEKVAGGTPIRFRDKSRFKERSKANNTGSQASDDGSVSGSGSW